MKPFDEHFEHRLLDHFAYDTRTDDGYGPDIRASATVAPVRSPTSDNECSSASNASRIPACRTVCSTTGLGTVCYARSSKTAKDARSSCLDGRTASQRHESMGIRSDPYALDPGIRGRAGDALRPAAGKAGRTPYTGRSATRVPIPRPQPVRGEGGGLMECAVCSTMADPESMNLCACCERPVCDDCVHLNAYGEPICFQCWEGE